VYITSNGSTVREAVVGTTSLHETVKVLIIDDAHWPQASSNPSDARRSSQRG
jgi:hypothetical protein